MRYILGLIVFFWAASACAQQNERYDYDVQWGYAEVATVSLRRGCPRDGYVPAKLSAESLGVADQLHAFQIKLDSFAEPTGRTLEGRTFIKEEGVPRRYRTRFAAAGTAFTQKTYRDKESTLRLTLRPGTHDLLSWFFAMRDMEMKAGSTHTFHVWDGWKLTRISALVGAVERIWTPVGTFDARRVFVTRVRLHHGRKNAYQARGAVEDVGTVWFTDNAARTPIAMDFRAPVGLAKLRLTRQSAASCPN